MRWFKFALMISLALAVGLVTALYQGQIQNDVMWGKQWGTELDESLDGMGSDKQGNIYIVGTTEGSLFGQNQGKHDIFLVKLDSAGQVLWSKQLGTVDDEEMAKIAVDSGGNIYLAITTSGDWFGQNMGGRDIVLVKLSANGQVEWGKRLGTSDDEFALSIASDNHGYIYVVGNTRGSFFAQYQRRELMGEEGFFAKFDSNGNLVWGKQFKDDILTAIAIDGQCNIYVGGWGYDDVNNTIITFLAKFTSDGTLKWRQVLPDEESINSLSVDGSGNVYVAGQVEVYIDENQLVSVPDAFITKHNGADGQRLWSKRFRSQEQNEQDEIYEVFDDITIDGQGNVYVVGSTEGSLFDSNLGERDVILAKFDGQGNMIWSKQWGSAKGESGLAIAVDETGSIYVAGGTNGNLFGTNAGEADIFVVKFRQ